MEDKRVSNGEDSVLIEGSDHWNTEADCVIDRNG